MRAIPILIITAAIVAACTSVGTSDATVPVAIASAPTPDMWLRPIAVPFTEGNSPNAARTELGRALFLDTRLSGSEMISCAFSHNPSRAWSDDTPARNRIV